MTTQQSRLLLDKWEKKKLDSGERLGRGERLGMGERLGRGKRLVGVKG